MFTNFVDLSIFEESSGRKYASLLSRTTLNQWTLVLSIESKTDFMTTTSLSLTFIRFLFVAVIFAEYYVFVRTQVSILMIRVTESKNLKNSVIE
uniref:Uncharacterized protein n=1 Tax=Strongyloides venezuelensis TaxID=75913 RepID=A0A0K0F122_STRVS